MGVRKFLAQLNKSLQGDDKSTDPSPTLTADPPVPPRPRSQLAIRPSDSESVPPTLQRRKSDGKQIRWSTHSQSVLTVRRNSWSDVKDSVSFRPSPPRSQCR